MEELLADIFAFLRETGSVDTAQVDQIIQKHNRLARTSVKRFAKKMIWPSYLRIKDEQPDVWEQWHVDTNMEAALRAAVRMKPRRTASGVATITVITRPAACSSTCSFCPSDVRMPKSYLHDEPACQRAERCYFDPYVQVVSRLRVLHEMGHPTDKVELIVLGGTFTDYPRPYQHWFIHELLRALNEADSDPPVAPQPRQQGWLCDTVAQRRARYQELELSCDPAVLECAVRTVQQRVDAGTLSYNHAIEKLYGPLSRWKDAIDGQQATREHVLAQQAKNEQAAHRNVGLVVETRPDCIDEDALAELRFLGCTKLQMGVQSLDEHMLATSGRTICSGAAARAFELLRAFGFKIHAHFMANLPGATPASDKSAWHTFMNDPVYQPDEVKLYPCALIAGTELERQWREGAWTPYSEEELVSLLADDVAYAKRWTRISRMIRDFSAGDIVAGNKKANLRQLVEQEVLRRAHEHGTPVCEMRMREIATGDIDIDTLVMRETAYETTNTTEYFLEWVDADDRLAAFLRLSLPLRSYIEAHPALPIAPDQAMIREVHVYGTAARLQQRDGSAQHAGLGRTLIERACDIARAAGYSSANVISAVGTRAYYRSLGFEDAQLYQVKTL